MKSKALIFFFSLAMPIPAFAVNTASSDTIVDVTDVNRVTVVEDDNVVKLRLQGNRDNPYYEFNYERTTQSSSHTSYSEHTSNWNFGSLLKKKKTTNRNWVGGLDFLQGFSFGMVGVTGAPQGMETSFGSSYEFMTELLAYEVASPRRRHHFSVGFGLNWRNYRMTGQQRFVKSDNGFVTLEPYPEGADVSFSRIKNFSLIVPFHYAYRIARNFYVDAAAIVNFNTYASIKTRYKLDGEKHKDFAKQIHQTPMTVDFMLSLSYDVIGIYAKYSPCNVLEKTYGPEFQYFSTGLVFNLF